MADGTDKNQGVNINTPIGNINVSDAVSQITRGHRAWGIIVAICMVVLGVLFLMSPIITNYVAMVAATCGFIVFGIYEIIVYARTPKEYKNGWTLANGILTTILGILIITSTPGEMYMTFAFLLGFMALYGGIMQCTEYALIRKAGLPRGGWVLTSGILNIIMSIFFIITPFAATWAVAYVLGIYLIIGGVALFAEAASGHHGVRH